MDSGFMGPGAKSQHSASGFLQSQILHRATAQHPSSLPGPSAAEPRSCSPRAQEGQLCPTRHNCFLPSLPSHWEERRDQVPRLAPGLQVPGWRSGAPRRRLLPWEDWQGGRGFLPPVPGSWGHIRDGCSGEENLRLLCPVEKQLLSLWLPRQSCLSPEDPWVTDPFRLLGTARL